jgi:hypothetical protein
VPVVAGLDRQLQLLAQLDQPAFAAVTWVDADADGDHSEIGPPIEQLIDRHTGWQPGC